MKQFLATLIFLFFCVFTYAQKIIEKPGIGMNTTSNVHVEKVELRDTTTVIWFHTTGTPGVWIRIPQGTYIQPVGSDIKLEVISTEGIPFNKEYYLPASGEVDYKLFFPAIDPSVSKIDYGEPQGGNWFIYDIALKPDKTKSIFPDRLVGDWFNGESGLWELSLVGSNAIYRSEVWSCTKYSDGNGVGKLSLKKGQKNLDIYIKSIGDSICMFGEKSDQLKKYTKTPVEKVVSPDVSVFQTPLFKLDTFILRGFVKGFNTRYPNRTGMVYVNNVLIGNQLSYVMKIEDDGTFQVKFAHCNPQEVMIRTPFSVETVFAEPGKTTFMLINNQNGIAPALFMGDNARLNSEMLSLKSINSYNYSEMTNKILDFSPEQYKGWCLDLLKKDLDALSEYQQKHHLSAKAMQVKELQLKTRYYMYLFEYTSNRESAYRSKNNVPNEQREIPLKPVLPDSSYYKFLTNEWVNSQLPMLSSDYYFFINRLKYASIFTGGQKATSTIELITGIGKSGESLTSKEKEFVKQLAKIEPQFNIKIKEFQDKYGKQSEAFYKLNTEMLQPLVQEKKGAISIAEIEAYLVSKKVEFNDQEKAFLEAAKEFEKDPVMLKYKELQNGISEFVKNHQDGINETFATKRTAMRDSAMAQIVGVQKGFVSDVMFAQDYCSSIAEKMTPVSKEKLQFIRKKISDPFISNYISRKNQETIDLIEANKRIKGSKGAVVNQVPKTEGDKLFNAIISKYKGKVVYVDFWATWCAPCRDGIERIKPLKEEMANENVVFVYITGETSPKATYDNMMPTIKGEHYRVSGDEWNFICGKFGISGIPRYMLVGKDGNIINPNLGHLENEQLKALLMKYIKE